MKIPGYSDVRVNFEPDGQSLIAAAHARMAALAASWNMTIRPEVEAAVAKAMAVAP